MLDEYLALGGVEIGNNQRAYAYAQCMPCCAGLLKCPGCAGIHDATNPWTDAEYEWVQQAVNLATNPSFEKAGSAVTVRTNLATNPSFEAATAATVEVRRNVAANPALGVDTLGWLEQYAGPGGDGTVARVVGTDGPVSATMPYRRMTWTVAPTSCVGYHGYGRSTVSDAPVTAGQTVTFSAYVRPIGFGARMSIDIVFWNAAGVFVSEVGGPGVFTSPGIWARPSVTLVVPATAVRTTVRTYFDSGDIPPIGATFDATGILVEQFPRLSTYFDGSTAAAGDFTHAWSGTANASASVQYGTQALPAIANATAGISPNTAGVLSSEWSASGSKSLRLVPTGPSTDTFYQLGGFDFTNFLHNKTYTVMATVRLVAPLVSPQSPPTMIALCDSPGFTTTSMSAPNAAGVYKLRVTFTVPYSGGSYCVVRLTNGASAGNGDVWWDDISIIEGNDASAPYFDGSNPVKVRRNLHPEPDIPTAGGWAPVTSGAGTLTRETVNPRTPGTAFLRGTVTASGGGHFRIDGYQNVRVGGTFTFSLYVRASLAREFTLQLLGFDSSNNVYDLLGSPLVMLVPGEWTRIVYTVTPPANVVRVNARYVWTYAADQVGFQADLCDILVESQASVGEFFTGSLPIAPYAAAWEGAVGGSPSYLYDPDFTYAWTGTANASTSTQKATGVAGGMQSSGVSGIQSAQWAKDRTHSLRVIRKASTENHYWGVTIGVAAPIPGGQQLTVSFESHVITPTSLDNGITIQEQGGAYRALTLIPIGTALTGDQRWVATVDLPSDWKSPNVIYFRPSVTVGVDIWYDNLLVVVGQYTGSYFDGAALPSEADPADTRVRWTGTADASTSALERYGLTVPAESAGEPPYDCSALSFAPWYDASNEASQRLAGFYILSVKGMTDSTMHAPVTEGLDDGGVIGAQRNSTRSVRVREMIVGCGMDAAEYGLAWLKAALSESFCARHGDACGTADLDFFIDCPPVLDPTDPDYAASTTRYRRFLHGVAATSGPILVDQWGTQGGAYVFIVEFILTAESPFVWGETLDITGSGQTLTAFDDIPFNLMRYPSGEVSDGIPAVVATQYAFNGSVEYGATGWNHSELSIPAGITAGVSNDIAAVGPASYRVRLAATGAVVDGAVSIFYDVPVTAIPAGAKPSVSMWGAALVFAGAPTVGLFRGIVEWRGTGGAVLNSELLGYLPINGGNLIAKGLTMPAGTLSARLLLQASDIDAAAGADLRVYADAFALTVP